MQRRVNSLTSLRFLAAAIVALQHAASPAFFKVGISLVDTRQAVSFFFVLSGFVLSHAYRSMDARAGLREFVAARVSRLWPAHVATAILAVLLVAPVVDFVGMAKLAINMLLLQSWVPMTQWYYSVNGVSWSISTEMFFYFVFPLALILIRRSVLRVSLIAVALVCVAVALASLLQLSPKESSPGITSWGILYISPVTRLAEFLAGMVAYQVALGLRGANWSPLKASILEVVVSLLAFVAMIAATKLAIHLEQFAPQAAVWVRVAGSFPVLAVLLAVLYWERGVVSRMLAWRPLVYLGEISFALYLLHQIILRWMFGRYREAIEANILVSYLLYWMLAIAGAAVIYHWVEKPCREPIRNFIRRPYPRLAS